MENQPDLKFLVILENIQRHFAFLFRRGFHIVSVIFVDQHYEDWQVTMATDDCTIKIFGYMGTVDLAFSIPKLQHATGLFELGDLIQGLDENEDFSAPAQEPPMNETPGLPRIAQLLEKHIDDILEKIEKMCVLLAMDAPSIPSSKLGYMFQYN